MFGYRKPYYKGGKKYYYKKYPYKNGTTVSRSLSAAAAAKKSTKTETYSCTVNGVFENTLAAGQNLSDVQVIGPYSGGLTATGIINEATNITHGGVINDRGFRLKAACYDECKLDSMKVKITPARIWAGDTFTNSLLTMWDRKANPKECGYAGNETWMLNGAMPTPLEIFNNEGTIKTTFTNNIIKPMFRNVYASSIIEKGEFVDSSIRYNDTGNQSPLRWMFFDNWLHNPMAFSPALYISVYSPATYVQNNIFSFNYSIEYTYTFRNPKSDMDWFLTVESPGYVNPVGREQDDLSRRLNALYESRTKTRADIQNLLLAREEKKNTKSGIQELVSTTDKKNDPEEKVEEEETMM